MKAGKGIRVALLALGVLLLTLIVLCCVYLLWEKEPVPEPTEPVLARQRTVPERLSGEPLPSPTPDPGTEPEAAGNRREGVYTLLLVGNDDGTGNTDTLLLVRFDSKAHQIDGVSIPRDTLINADWEVRKINSVYWSSKAVGGNGIDFLKDHIAALTGFRPDFYAVMDLDVFVEAVDAIGGIPFDVPIAMDYDDSSQNLHIHLQPGLQTLNGEQAMGLCRFRSSYANGDLGRIEMQHQFLQAAAEQFITLGSIPNAPKLVDILSRGLDTDLSGANIAWFFRQLLLCRSEDIHFYTMPNYPEMIAGYSYAVVNLWPWLEMVNQQLRPFDREIQPGDLDLVYAASDGYAATTWLRGEEYYSRGLLEPEPEDTPEEGAATLIQLPEDSPEPTEEPGVGEEPEPDDRPAIIILEP